ncbi:Kelch-like protein diablo [Thalictrum thalictroides]|uniref:Kelch-like protein diablo n=1 Tax=Thalictrum thalictroides TaxID=46969 RepID=A0A7J6W6U4_THATH|nr:Kelch-like protein diablo [Thalictrum thalictroides]
MVTTSLPTRNLSKSDLGGVIFGCTYVTMKECLAKKLFGLPGQHISYVQNIEPGLPLFLFNYSDRKLYGIFEAECQGKCNIDQYGWSSNGSERTRYPAQVNIRTRIQCEPLVENQFKPIIADNYYSSNRFYFELDRTQACALISLFGSSPVIGAPKVDAPVTGASIKWIPKLAPKVDAAPAAKDLTPSVPKADSSFLDQSDRKLEVLSQTLCLTDNNQLLESQSNNGEVEGNEKQIIYFKLKKWALEHEHTKSSPTNQSIAVVVPSNGNEDESVPETLPVATHENQDSSAFGLQTVIHQLTQGMEELKNFSQKQLHNSSLMEKKMVESELEIQLLKERVQLLESQLVSSTTRAGDKLHSICDGSIFLLGGYDGHSWLSTLDCYSPCKDILRFLQPMSTSRSHAAAAVLNNHIYMFGGGNGDVWCDKVEAYNPSSDEWTLCPSLSVEKGNLAGTTLHGKLFAIGGGNKNNCLSDVEMFDPSLERWVHTQAMLEKRFAPASATLNGVLYSAGGYDGNNYLNSAERFDPRVRSWAYLPNMNTRRGCHSLLAFNEKLYAVGGYDGTKTVSSVEVLDPRFGSWTSTVPMNQSRGYAGAVVIGKSMYVIGGVQSGQIIVDTVEHYEEDNGWSIIKSTAVGKRCFFSAVVF